MTESTRPRYLTCAETAKLVRKALREEFPGVKFYVRSSVYSGGASIHVGWTDGPTGAQVDHVVWGFKGADFDGMIDLKTHASSWLCEVHSARTAERYGHSYESQNGPVASRCCWRAELVHMGADYIFGQRDYSDEFKAWAQAKLERETGEPYDGNKFVWNDYMSTLLYREMQGVAIPTGAEVDRAAMVLPQPVAHAIAGDNPREAPLSARLLLVATAGRKLQEVAS